MLTRRIVAVIALLAGLFLLSGLAMGGLMLWPGMMHYGLGYGFAPRLLPWLGVGVILFKASLIAVGLVLLFELFRGRPAQFATGTTTSRPMEILRERYARGEIDKAQYDQMRRDLGEQ